MFNLGPWELIIILFVVLIVFGPGRLPDLGKGLGEGIKNFKKGIKDSKAIDATHSEEQADIDSKKITNKDQ